MRCLYVDLDRTLLGAESSLLHDGAGEPSAMGVAAVLACLHAGVEVVIVSGRGRAQASEDARLLGQRAFVFEAGAGLVLDERLLWQTGAYAPRDGLSIFEQITASGAPRVLLEHYAGRLEYHDPWNDGRCVSHVLRGLVDCAEADAVLRESGHGALRLIENGVLKRRPKRALAALPHLRGYHLLPRGVSKAAGCLRHRLERGYAREECVAVGDSREDLGMAAHVGTFWLVANALERDPSLGLSAAGLDNVRIAGASYGAGVHEAVAAALR